MKHLVLCAAGLLSACAGTAPAQQAYAPMFHYIRSNQDGSSPENIYVYRRDAEHLEVGKQVSRCTNSAFVTAELDRERGQPLSLVGGRLTRELTQEAFAWLTYNRDTRNMRLQFPPANVDSLVRVEGEPWMMFDFDLADLNGLFAGRAPAREDFRYAVGLLWGSGSSWDFVNRGYMNARYANAERHLDRDTLRFEVSGALNGQLWLDADRGFIVEAAFAEPNHSGYDNFRLVLQQAHTDGAAAWLAARRAHWEGCEDES